jgi:Methyltransferase TRM13
MIRCEDLALQSLHNAVLKLQKPIVQGVCIALCCHHQCTWNTYVGKSFFEVRLFLMLRCRICRLENLVNAIDRARH